jgi:Zinc-finger double-stranded RNA-binding
MKYTCRECLRSFENEEAADAHEKGTKHHVELSLATTYWGEHFILE